MPDYCSLHGLSGADTWLSWREEGVRERMSGGVDRFTCPIGTSTCSSRAHRHSTKAHVMSPKGRDNWTPRSVNQMEEVRKRATEHNALKKKQRQYCTGETWNMLTARISEGTVQSAADRMQQAMTMR